MARPYPNMTHAHYIQCIFHLLDVLIELEEQRYPMYRWEGVCMQLAYRQTAYFDVINLVAHLSMNWKHHRFRGKRQTISPVPYTPWWRALFERTRKGEPAIWQGYQRKLRIDLIHHLLQELALRAATMHTTEAEKRR